MLQDQNRVKNVATAGILLGSTLVSVAAISSSIRATASPLNPCPRVYYEEPFNSTRRVPQGCPPNAATQQLTQSETQSPVVQPGVTPSEDPTPLQPPLQEDQANAITTVALTNGLFNVRVINNTNTSVSYQVIGYTPRRYLQGGGTANLQGIPAPATILFVRQDNGFVDVIPVSTTEPGLLNISLDEDTNSGDINGGALRIQDDGQVYLN
jgi:hypothetical protein